MVEFNDLLVYKSPYEKTRLGIKCDGGYVIAKLPFEYDILLSGGIGPDVSFEKDFQKLYKSAEIHMYDAVVGEPILQRLREQQQITPSMNIHRKNIKSFDNEKVTSLVDMITPGKKIFVKMDIEGSEFEWVDKLPVETLDNIDQLAIEIHHPHKNQNWGIFKKLNKTHKLIHIHANNNEGLAGYALMSDIQTSWNGFGLFPRIAEYTYVHKSYINSTELNDEPFPQKYDWPNRPVLAEPALYFPPFCTRE